VFLSLGGDRLLKYLVAGNAVAAFAFARMLARKVVPGQPVDPHSDDRIPWLALRCGSIILGLMTAFLLAGTKPKLGGPATPLEFLNLLRKARSQDFLSRLRCLLTVPERNLFVNSDRP
jgi:hypothetical protein